MALSLPYDKIHEYQELELEERAKKNLVQQAVLILNLETKYQNDLDQQAKREELDSNREKIQEARDKFSHDHDVFRNWSLADEKWDQYFDDAQEQLEKEKAAIGT